MNLCGELELWKTSSCKQSLVEGLELANLLGDRSDTNFLLTQISSHEKNLDDFPRGPCMPRNLCTRCK